VSLPRRPLGKSALSVSIVGFGAGPLGDARLSEATVDALVGAALDRGVTLFDTAPSYGTSEARLARALGVRRKEVVLATKGGYGVEGVADWTPDVIRLGIEQALGRLRTDVIDVFFLHSCDVATLERGEVLDALERARSAGKIRLAGYSGDEEPLRWAVRSRRFDVVECSVSLLDRAALEATTLEAREHGIGVFAKRPLANGAMGSAADDGRPDLQAYRERARTLAIDTSPLMWAEAAVRFACFAPGVTSALVGTTKEANLGHAVDAALRGPLDAALQARLDAAWNERGRHFRGVV
jgi:aryl-alcohol dehydrogenase-like predicted oxidoreductase